MFHKAKKLATHVLPGVVRPIHILWNQVIGFIFLALATVFGFRVFRGHEPVGMQLAGGAFVLLMAWFGISAFWRARKISKS
ncbi:MAG TPA: hypothetical protein VKT81_28655 [Bryobacteraceae bacterium]|nr:hypothetical protein [Bryobacteraceae bacterium]